MAEKVEEEKAALVWICRFCGAPYETKEQASQCWDSHSELTFEPVWGGIGTGHQMPIEVLIQKHERGYITEIATYKLDRVDKVQIRERKK